MDEDESLLAHNSEYAAVHEAAHGITLEEQRSEIALMCEVPGGVTVVALSMP